MNGTGGRRGEARPCVEGKNVDPRPSLVPAGPWQRAGILGRPRRHVGLLLLGLIGLPALLVAYLLSEDASDARFAVAIVDAPLLIALCMYPHVGRNVGRTGILFQVVTAAYGFEFGVRSLLLCYWPQTATFPNLLLPQDYRSLEGGVIWASLGIFSMEVTYYEIQYRRRARGPGMLRSISNTLAHANRPSFFVCLCSVGAIGELHAIATGSVLYLYNSPSFGDHGNATTTSTSGLFAVMADCMLVGASGLLALGLIQRRRRLIAIASVLLGSQGIYFAYGSYKYGVIGLGVIVVLIIGLEYGTSLRALLPIGIVALLLLFPIMNTARSNSLSYTLRGGESASRWLSIFSRSLGQATSTNGQGVIQHFVFPVVERFNGAEALAVADKYEPAAGLQGWKDYANILELLLPSGLRGHYQPRYIAWSTMYVGDSPNSLNVIPMPALVEAYVSFGWIGEVVVMGIFGALIGSLDILAQRWRNSAVHVALFCYVGWRLLDIEEQLFIVLIPIIKVGVTVASLAYLFGLIAPDWMREQVARIGAPIRDGAN